METLEKFIKGVRIALPGIVVAAIFHVFANVAFDQFFFLVFCIIAMGVVRVLSDALVVLYRWSLQVALFVLKKSGFVQISYPSAKVRRMTAWTRAGRPERLVMEIIVALFCGLVLLKSYEEDLAFALANNFVHTERTSIKPVLNMVLDSIAKGEYADIDKRPDDKKGKCRVIGKGCYSKVFVKLTLEDQPGEYEGHYLYYLNKGEERGLYLSPACLIKKGQNPSDTTIDPVPGPGVYIGLSEIKTIQLVDLVNSRCADHFYGKPASPGP